jgi:DNA-binding CsgD family transcriptional regulator
MGVKYKSYDLFFRFIKTYLPVGFEGINRHDPLILELEVMMDLGDQFMLIGDLIKYEILFTSENCSQLLGIEPNEFTKDRFFEIRHPDEARRQSLIREKTFKVGHQIYNEGEGEYLISEIFRMRNKENKYDYYLIQAYHFYAEIPHKTAYLLEIHTLINDIYRKKYEHHHYYGSDLTYFRYPDDKLLRDGCIFSEREFEVIELMAKGLKTLQVADKLNVSPFTINTHRSNILQKSGKKSIPELIAWLTETGRI